MELPEIIYDTVDVDGIAVSYREADPGITAQPGVPILLLHGFPSGSHQYRRLVDALGTHRRVVAPDYPGFGPTGVSFPDRKEAVTWTFDWLADVVEGFVDAVGLEQAIVYVFDWGGPVGFRLATRRPDFVRGLVVQNANAYDEGLSSAARAFVTLDRERPGSVQQVIELLHEEGTRSQYLTGSHRGGIRVAPESWLLDQAYLDRGDRVQAQLDLAFDYRSNLEQYEVWQSWLRQRQPPTLVIWGRNDPFFVVDGALAYLRDVPEADVHLLDAGHFALEERAETIATLVRHFAARLDRKS